MAITFIQVSTQKTKELYSAHSQVNKCSAFSLCSSIVLLISQQAKTRNNILLNEELLSAVLPYFFLNKYISI